MKVEYILTLSAVSQGTLIKLSLAEPAKSLLGAKYEYHMNEFMKVKLNAIPCKNVKNRINLAIYV